MKAEKRGQLRLDSEQRLAQIRELKEQVRQIQTPDISWEQPNTEDE